jgi:DNA repair protein RecO
MSRHSFSTSAIVLKRVNTGEYDRIVTLLTPDEGKVTCVAKGVRKLSSSQRAYLEPGNHVTVMLIHTKNLPILTQTKLIDNFSHSKKDLQNIKKLAEVLEIIDRLFPEGVEEQELFEQMLNILRDLNDPATSFVKIKDQLSEVLVQLGYPHIDDTHYTSVLDYVSSVAERPMHSYDYLTVKPKEE